MTIVKSDDPTKDAARTGVNPKFETRNPKQIQNPESKPPDTPRGAVGRFARSFYYAFAGLGYLFRTQRNARIEAIIGAAACALAAWLRIDRFSWAILLLTIVLVLILEGLNSSIEMAIDLACPRRHPMAKAAKDLAAGMVLIASIASVGVGLLILGPPLWMRLGF